ncbi:5-formyltetrahydrofolate cyclo-ligase [Pseudofulvibacter geojedonensis]|uniref:5-formyltetrahydrofolate cyclo-ligase n=1 Tax=Pseudofulvibacter geojedonensis TaxID=1123758 RepID=A0ABW3I1H9_9FLAO
MFKKDLRKLYKVKRSKLSLDQIDQLSMVIANNLLKLPIWEKTYYHLFLSIEEQKEIQTEYILHILHAKDKEIVVSKSNFENNTLTNYLLTDNTKIKKNQYNIPEPIDGIEVPHNKLDVVFIPLLTFDKKGNRVGYGKGFYDKMLANCSPDCIKIGLSFFEAENEIADTFEGDIPLDYCITPEKVYSF